MVSHEPTHDEPPFLLLGRVLRPHGIRGELRVEVLTAYPERIMPEDHVYLGLNPADPESVVEYEIAGARRHKQYLILQLEGLSDRDEAELLRDQYVMVALDDAVPLEEDEFYLYQIIGLPVYTEDDEHLGEVVDVIETGANDVYVVRGPRGEILLPAIEECILDVDIEGKRVTVRLMEGLLGD
ncbi:MAG TPA: ribosome maturation factor RimM [Aggregatilinea sp.]|jgi:16S rRNA processing protein RimM|uniref:ribosome maturation factor RimM n=1 Tax=Aggregatilinea sp. TaxID=2806333 RepID=UPI002BB62B56|nr:ribosome maturation factor RimM [Aggregatilinea sp.]HML20785.1 ribosome maturation factor RimM [Aggregatilinea sp.]